MAKKRMKQERAVSANEARRTASVGASLTVEASFCVPVVFLAVYVFLQSAMSEVVREVSEYGTVFQTVLPERGRLR